MIPNFQAKLLSWYDLQGRKNLPWQQNKTPYRVWISEIMLQQTQVQTVIPYFNRFMARFADLNKLADANEDEVLYLWAGLGYYSRARNLLKTAKLIRNTYAGKFPDQLAELIKLPGIGKSTAGAILAIAFEQPTPILDGNVKRVLSRVFAIKTALKEKKTEQKLWKLAAQLTPNQRIADYTQAMMDLGATLCMRTKPLCNECPFHTDCIAKKKNLVDRLPIKIKTKQIPHKDATFILLLKGKKVLLCKRPSYGIWGGLWTLPEINGIATKEQIKKYCKIRFNIPAANLKKIIKMATLWHTFTHFRLTLHPFLAMVKTEKIMADTEQIWYKLDSPGTLGLPKPINLLLKSISGK